MIIKGLTASFGRLQNETLTLAPGLNIIEAPNECGKSTWCAFIKAMLYGIRTADRDKTGYLSDKTRYRPWSGAPMAGAMELIADGAAVTIERKSDGKLPMKDFSAYYTGTGDPYPGLAPDTAGETLLGVSEAVFERSAYISQAGLRVTQTPELEKRISALVTTGDEGASYTETDERLRAWLRKRRFNKSGSIPALEEKIDGCTRRLRQIEAAVEETAAMRLEAERLGMRRDELTGELEALNLYEARQAYRRAEEKLQAAKAGAAAAYAELTKNGPAPDEAAVSAIRGEKQALASLLAIADRERAQLEEARRNLDALQARTSGFAFDGDNPSRAADSAVSLEAGIRKLSFGSPAAVATILLTVTAAAAAVYAGAAAPDYPLLLPAAAVAVLGLILLIWRLVRLGRRRGALRQLLSRHGAASAAALKRLAEDYAALLAAVRDAEGDVRSSEKALAAAESMYEAARRNLAGKLSAYSLGQNPEGIDEELRRVERLLEKLSAAKSEVRAAESYMKTLRDSGADVPESGKGESPPVRSRQEAAAELQETAGRYDDLMRRCNMALGETRALGDPVILGSELKTAEDALAAQRAQYEALSLAIETLKDANSELQLRFSPMLSEAAGRIIQRLTGGRYERLTFDKTLDAFAKTSGEAVSRNILSLSAGTADQIYLALRLAVCELVLPGGDPCPLILDDALTNFDDTRARAALDYLAELSRSRQILLFTCHGREAAYAEKHGANLVRL